MVILVAELYNKAVGFIIAYKKKKRAYVENIAVRSQYRGRGIGSVLLTTLEDKLAGTGVSEVYLSVKSWNTKALNFYLNKNYGIRGVVLIMSAKPGEINVKHYDSYVVSDLVASSVKKTGIKPITWWSNLVDDTDFLVYRKFYREERALIVKKNRYIKAITTYTLNDELTVDSMRLSSYNALEVLETTLNALKYITLVNNAHQIEIPVDASKKKLVGFLEETGFRVKEAEYLLSKKLR